MSNANNVLNAYAEIFKSWSGDRAKLLGAKPTAEQITCIHGLGLRPGKQALANAMMLREKGATANQIVMACGAPQLNRMRGLIADAYVRRDMHVSKTAEGHTVYKLELTAKGKAKVERTAKAQAAAEAAGKVDGETAVKKPAKAKGKAAKKADKPAAATVDATSEAASVTVTAPEAVEANQPQV